MSDPAPTLAVRTAEMRGLLNSGIDLRMVMPEKLRRAIPALLQLLTDLDAVAKFKAFVHSYLDQHGVPHGDPENEHQKQGCRIGARLDLLFAQRDAPGRDAEALAGALESTLPALRTAEKELASGYFASKADEVAAVLAAHNASRAKGEGTDLTPMVCIPCGERYIGRGNHVCSRPEPGHDRPPGSQRP